MPFLRDNPEFLHTCSIRAPAKRMTKICLSIFSSSSKMRDPSRPHFSQKQKKKTKYLEQQTKHEYQTVNGLAGVDTKRVLNFSYLYLKTRRGLWLLSKLGVIRLNKPTSIAVLCSQRREKRACHLFGTATSRSTLRFTPYPMPSICITYRTATYVGAQGIWISYTQPPPPPGGSKTCFPRFIQCAVVRSPQRRRVLLYAEFWLATLEYGLHVRVVNGHTFLRCACSPATQRGIPCIVYVYIL